MNTLVSRAILSVIPTALIAVDSSDMIIFANASAARLLQTPRDHLEGGSIARFVDPGETISPQTHTVTFATIAGHIEVVVAAKELLIDDQILRVVLLKPPTPQSNDLADIIIDFQKSQTDPFEYVCNALVKMSVAKYACIRSTTSTQCDILASTTDNREIFVQEPSISRSVSRDGHTHVELVIVPHPQQGLRAHDLRSIDVFIALLHLRMDTSESAWDAVGSETALALALKAGDMGMCFFDTTRGDAFLSDQLATWCSIDNETFPGTLNAWLATFREDDRTRITALFAELDRHKKFKTIVHIETLEGVQRLELTGRPLHENSSAEWVAIAREYSNEEEVQAAWQTRIAMEEAARVEAEELLENFEKTLTSTLLPTTSDVSIVHSRQDAGTWHIVRPLNAHTSVYAIGAVTATNRAQAVVDATICATMADVIATHCDDVDLFVELLCDHARARDIETTIAAVRVVDGTVSACTHAGASVFISGRPFTGTETITATTAISLSTHSVASPDTIDVAANGRPWKIMTSVVEVVSLPDETPYLNDNSQGISTGDTHSREELIEDDENENNDIVHEPAHDNVTPFRSGSISPS